MPCFFSVMQSRSLSYVFYSLFLISNLIPPTSYLTKVFVHCIIEQPLCFRYGLGDGCFLFFY